VGGRFKLRVDRWSELVAIELPVRSLFTRLERPARYVLKLRIVFLLWTAPSE
jgi:hypothetical protein